MSAVSRLNVGPAKHTTYSTSDGAAAISKPSPSNGTAPQVHMLGIDQLTARDVMQQTLVCTAPQNLLSDVERELIETHISGMPVIAEGKLVGVISRSDLARAQVLTEELDGQVTDEMHWDVQADGFEHQDDRQFAGFRDRFQKMRVKDVMRTQVVTCEPATKIVDLAAAMIRHHIHRLIVVEADKPVGIISSLDLVALVAKSRG
jgi:CBS domain-containing protein